MKKAVICSELGWTLEEYDSQPSWFIDLLYSKMSIDAWRSKSKIK